MFGLHPTALYARRRSFFASVGSPSKGTCFDTSPKQSLMPCNKLILIWTCIVKADGRN